MSAAVKDDVGTEGGSQSKLSSSPPGAPVHHHRAQALTIAPPSLLRCCVTTILEPAQYTSTTYTELTDHIGAPCPSAPSRTG